MRPADFLKLYRLPNSIMAGSGVILGQVCIGGVWSASDNIFGFLAMMFLAMAGNIQNDIADRLIDIEAHPERPLAALPDVPGLVRASYAFLYILGIAAAGAVSAAHGTLAAFMAILLWTYNVRVKRYPLAGNIIISILCALAIYFPEYPGIIRHTSIPACFAFLTTLVRELLKDIQDKDADLSAGYETFPIKYGTAAAVRLSRVVLITILLLLPFPAVYFGYGLSFLAVSLGAVVPFLFSALHLLNSPSPDWEKAQKKIKYLMLGGMAAVAAGKLIAF